MIVRYRCVFGQPLPLDLSIFGKDCEINSIEFIEALPFEWRIVSAAGRPPTPWVDGRSLGQVKGYHNLQFVTRKGANKLRGIAGELTTLETHGIGDSNVLATIQPGSSPEIWVRA